MCHLMEFPRDVLVTPAAEADLRRAASLQGDGAGFAVMTEHGLITGTDMDSGAAIDRFIKIRNFFPSWQAAFHARYATTGEVCEDQCHPVEIVDHETDTTTAVFLNGTLDIPLAKGENDTEAFAFRYIKGEYRGHGLNPDRYDDWASIERLCQRTNAKLLIMTDDRYYDRNVYMFNADQWITTPYGAHASNADHLPKGTGWDEVYVCPECGYRATPASVVLHPWDLQVRCPRHGPGMDLFRFNLTQPGQCANCHLYGHETGTCGVEYTTPQRWRNVTQHQRDYARERS